MASFEVTCPITGERFQIDGSRVAFDKAPKTLVYGYFRCNEYEDPEYYYAPGLDSLEWGGEVHVMANEHGRDWEDAQSLGLAIKTFWVEEDPEPTSQEPEGDASGIPSECFLGLFCDQPDKFIAWFNDRHPPSDYA